MGTNYHWLTVNKPAELQLANGTTIPSSIDDMDPRVHIGKRSGAGRYCRSCDVPLAANPSRIHYGDAEVLDGCPECGVESAFCAGVCSFSFAQDPSAVRAACQAKLDTVIVENEYGETFTGAQFLELLDAIPACYVFTDTIGVYFC